MSPQYDSEGSTCSLVQGVEWPGICDHGLTLIPAWIGDDINSSHKASDAELWCLFDLRMNNRLGEQSRRRRFEKPPRLLWRHCNVPFIFQGARIAVLTRVTWPSSMTWWLGGESVIWTNMIQIQIFVYFFNRQKEMKRRMVKYTVAKVR